MNVADMITPNHALHVAAQGDAAWLQERLGKLTGSRMAIAMSFLKNGQESAERRQLKFDLVAERLTDCLTSRWVSPPMEWGIAMEPEAKKSAKKLIGIDILPIGFCEHPTICDFGSTPDGRLEDPAGLVEIKCPTTPVFLKWLLANEVPPEHRAQMTAQVVCVPGARYVQFLAYDPRVPKRPILYKRYAPTQQERDKVEQAAIQFLGEVEELFERVSTSRAPRC